MSANFHTPVMPGEALQFWVHKPDGVYVDLTLGMGGHSEALLKNYPEAKLFGFDWDAESLKLAGERLSVFGDRFKPVHQNFAGFSAALKAQGIEQVDGVLFDLGFSSYQMLHSGRGLSFQKEEPLDMRLSRELLPYTAASFIKNISEEEMAKIFMEYAEIAPNLSRRIARALAASRLKAPIRTTLDLMNAVGIGNRKILSQIFQALRIAVNAEMRNLETLLSQIWTMLSPGARVVGISFHSLEDRIVKKSFQEREKMGRIKILTRKPLVPSLEEVRANPKSRSAKLRAAELL